MEPSTSNLPSLRFAVLFAYNGLPFDGLERSKGSNSIESILLSTLASVAGKGLDSSTHISLLNISRASATEEGESAARQVMSLEMAGSDALVLPTPEQVNPLLPEGLKVFRIAEVPQGFSARRTCEARTYEFLLPTFVFAPPAPGTHYAYPLVDDEEGDEEFAYPDDFPVEQPAGGLFKTLKRGLSISRKKQDSARDIPSIHVDEAEEASSSQVKQGSSSPTSPNSPSAGSEKSTKKKSTIGRWLSKLLFGQQIPTKLKREEAIEKALANGTISRKKSLRRSEAPAIALEVPKTDRLQAGNMASSHHQDADGPFSGMSGLMTTLKRSLSRRDPRGNEFNNLTDASPPALSSPVSEDEIQTFDPLVIPWDEEYLKTLRAYRLTESQSKMLHYIFSIYNGTHNWHNYIPGASPDDPRCYLRILNIEVSPAEMHNGLEWIRIKVQAKAFARLQVRKMVAFAVMVTRTNTPRSVVANSFGYAKFHVPEVPAQGLILDEPHYSDYNAYAAQLSRSVIDFEGINDSVEEFRRSNIHESLYTAEAKDMLFAKWIRNMDSYSFLYTHFLNTRGLILKNVAAA